MPSQTTTIPALVCDRFGTDWLILAQIHADGTWSQRHCYGPAPAGSAAAAVTSTRLAMERER